MKTVIQNCFRHFKRNVRIYIIIYIYIYMKISCKNRVLGKSSTRNTWKFGCSWVPQRKYWNFICMHVSQRRLLAMQVIYIYIIYIYISVAFLLTLQQNLTKLKRSQDFGVLESQRYFGWRLFLAVLFI